MMKIKGIEGMTGPELAAAIDEGGRFVYFQYCVSAVLLTSRNSSDIYFIRGGDGTLAKSLPCSLLTFFLGWWGIPWGPIYTIGALAKNFGGGVDVTREVLRSLPGDVNPPA